MCACAHEHWELTWLPTVSASSEHPGYGHLNFSRGRRNVSIVLRVGLVATITRKFVITLPSRLCARNEPRRSSYCFTISAIVRTTVHTMYPRHEYDELLASFPGHSLGTRLDELLAPCDIDH